ncbi:deoxyguanosinetriphosphate triphosphohydrolase family protein [Peribacillus frigoritolerans]|uniref:deoxyguanosinetriphosphate triphosphohydrolase family protein n=1 Tax=Peribacillus frigoritolerans TaxID=450367 RepID=UPI00105A1409|nr:dNTP triphosphohydrolase [Peribacillus frigoritolerans]TDL82080.1 dNTP triphosphohydrolase [Peribacillus frigoritolerans]
MDRNKSELLDFLKEFYYPLKNLNKRIHFEEPTQRARNEYQRDYSRILYSTSFRRLQGKMQLLGIQNDKFYRNRLTHSLEVAQIARGIAERLRTLSGDTNVYIDDTYVVEAGALAHDIGNPPFGHHGEKVLNKLMKEKGGFEGNAQTLRVLNELEKKLPKRRGLNLTIRTLLSVVKYYKPYDEETKKFIYKENFLQLKDLLTDYEVLPRTVDVQIVDLADEIAYAAHDLEDALSLGLFNIDEFMFEFKDEVGKNEDYLFLQDLVKKAKFFARSASNYHSSEEFGLLLRKELTSNLVNELVNDIGIIEVDKKFKLKTATNNDRELGFKTLDSFADCLKAFTFKCINRSNIVQIYEKQGEKIIKGLFDAFIDDEFNKDNLLLPVEFRGTEQGKERMIADYISGMMDSYSVQVFQKLYGKNSIDVIYDVNYFGKYKI